jgi:hypothetical protein
MLIQLRNENYFHFTIHHFIIPFINDQNKLWALHHIITNRENTVALTMMMKVILFHTML